MTDATARTGAQRVNAPVQLPGVPDGIDHGRVVDRNDAAGLLAGIRHLVAARRISRVLRQPDPTHRS